MIRFAAKLSAAGLLAATLFVGAARAGDDGKCTIATKPDTETGRACAKGGRAEAKKVMKEMVKKAKANGQKFTCDGCHKDLDNYALTKNAQDDYKKLVAAQTK
jgi:hypothetical protein